MPTDKLPPALRLEDTALGLSEAAIWESMAPFVRSRPAADSQEWKAIVAKASSKIARRRLKRLLFWWQPGTKRDQTVIERSYTEAWSNKAFELYDPASTAMRVDPWQWRGRPFMAASGAGARARLWFLMRSIEKLAPRSVVELGSGNGVNLLLLACRFPDIEFHGVELTEGGVGMARSAQQLAELPELLQRFSPEPLVDLTAHRRISFNRGSAAETGFDKGRFDLAYTSLALEQMEQIRPQALAEISRITSRHTVMIEPFRDTNDTGLLRTYALGMDHYRGTIAELASHGLDPFLISPDMPGRIWLQPCMVWSQKRG